MFLPIADRLPLALDPDQSPVSAARPAVVGHPVLIGAQTLSMACFVVAAWAFTVQAAQHRDELLRWLGPACAVNAFARLNYVLFPSVYSDWLYSGDLLRTASYLLLLVGSAREIRQYWASQTQLALAEDRRRLARELHDGVVQELGYIRSQSHRFRALDGVRADRVIDACDRALAEAREAVDVLAQERPAPLSVVLRHSAQQVAQRYDVVLDLALDDSVGAETQTTHALLRIAREAMSNAVRHGGASRIALQLRDDGDCRVLTVRDDGCGFDVSEALHRRGGFGLTSMRQRAQGLPGRLHIASEPQHGTEITVRW